MKQQLVKVDTQLPQLRRDYASFLNNPSSKNPLYPTLFQAIQPIGSLLTTADYAKCDLTLTARQVEQLQRLEDTQKFSGPDANGQLAIIGPDVLHTLTKLPVPIQISGPAGGSVFLESSGGGQFENGLCMAEYTIPKSGSFTAYWVTQGDSVGHCEVTIRSPHAFNERSVNLRVVKLHPIGLPQVDELKQQIQQGAPTSAPNTPISPKAP